MKGKVFTTSSPVHLTITETHLECINNSFPNTDSYRERFASLLNRLSDDKFVIDIGNENVKCRYGHIF